MFKRYVYNCIEPESLKELSYIINTAEEIARKEFIKKVSQKDLKALEKLLGYSNDFKMENDWHVSYWKSFYKGQEIYYFCHSGIEYVFKQKDF